MKHEKCREPAEVKNLLTLVLPRSFPGPNQKRNCLRAWKWTAYWRRMGCLLLAYECGKSCWTLCFWAPQRTSGYVSTSDQPFGATTHKSTRSQQYPCPRLTIDSRYVPTPTLMATFSNMLYHRALPAVFSAPLTPIKASTNRSESIPFT